KYKVTGNAQGETVQQWVTVNGKAPTNVNLNWR
ncbi:MAG: carboxypeptidase regulatory-like domain-containing protein, partial [Pseudomonas putida]